MRISGHDERMLWKLQDGFKQIINSIRRNMGETRAGRKQNRIQKRLYSLPEAAEYLGRSEWSVRRLVWEGKLPQVRCGRRVHLDIEDIDKFIESNKITEWGN
jgi:excisionase family DNA binding protein